MEKNVNMSINDGEAFFAHELSINFNPLQFTLDFKSVTPRVDARSKDSLVLSLKHNVIIVDPYHAKKIFELLGQTLSNFENEFGKIEKPKALEKYEKKVKSNTKPNTKPKGKADTKSPSYFG